MSIALISPIQPIWNRSSTFSLDCEKRLITLRTSLRFPLIYSSLACISPCSIFSKSACFSSFLSTGSFDVFTPHISTFPSAISTILLIFLLYLCPKAGSHRRSNICIEGVNTSMYCSMSFPGSACHLLLQPLHDLLLEPRDVGLRDPQIIRHLLLGHLHVVRIVQTESQHDDRPFPLPEF